MKKKEVDPIISKYFSDLVKKRKNPYYAFNDKDIARKAGEAGRKTQRAKRENSDTGASPSQEKQP